MTLRALAAVAALALPAVPARAQVFQDDPTSIPGGPVANGGFTENVELYDGDGDGDLDALWADGGDFGNEQNRVWINLGGAQGGVAGTFADETAARYPAVLDDSRDIDFADFDLDGDFDAFVSNTSGQSNQTTRFLINMGGAQGGAEGYFQDQTASRWVGLGQDLGGTARSSVAASHVMAGGGFIDWSCDSALGDLDGDGDVDLIQASYGDQSTGKVPTRIFLNDGAGRFVEFNPSGHQLAGSFLPPGSPGIWAEGLHQPGTQDTTGAECDVANESISVDPGDLDGDFDLDFILGDKSELPRAFANRAAENGGTLGFRDVSWITFQGPDWAPGIGSYEQELGDLDDDGDLDLYGTNWVAVCDVVAINDGSGAFGPTTAVPESCTRHFEADWVDYDNDGAIDCFAVSRSADEEMYRNGGPAAGHALVRVTATVLPAVFAQALGSDAGDIDLDGDADLLLANDQGDPDALFRNTSSTPDTFAPRIPALEQAPDRAAGPAPTVVRAHVLDNAPWYVTAFADATLEYEVGGVPATTPMRFVGGQLFHAEIPGLLAGSISYRAVVADAAGNSATTPWRSFVAAPCHGDPIVYCTAKVHSNGCVPAIGSIGTPSASASSGFWITSGDTLADKSGLLFYGRTGPRETPYQGGFLCVQPPTIRTPLQNSGSAGAPPCSGTFAFDFNAWLAAGKDPFLGPGDEVWAQYWSRDPGASFHANRSDALRFHLCP
jgi:hypothetical protein